MKKRELTTEEYPIVTHAMLKSVKAPDDMHIGDYHSAMVSLPNVSFQAVQDVFATLYNVHGADPRYLFISEDDVEYFSHSLVHAVVSMHHIATRIANQSTQRLVHVVPLPDLPQGTILCGFFGGV